MRTPNVIASILLAAAIATTPMAIAYAEPQDSTMELTAPAQHAKVEAPSVKADADQYATRQTKDSNTVAKFRGGGEVVLIGGGTLTLVLLVVLLVILV